MVGVHGRRSFPALGHCLALVLLLTAACAEEAEPLGNARVDDDDDDAAPQALPVVGAGVDEVPSQQAPTGAPYPIILVHGFSGWMDVGSLGYFYRVKGDFEAAGADVTTPALPPYDSSADRAVVLSRVVDEVLARTNKRKVHLIAHSQGGIDSRILLTDLGYADRVASLVTISTPHRGTKVADLAKVAPNGVINAAGQLLGWLLGALDGEPPSDATWLADDDIRAAYDPDLAAAIATMRTDHMADFNESHPDPAGVPIFSVSGVSNLLPLDQSECRGGLWDNSGRVDAVDPLFAGAGLYLNYTDGGNLFRPTPNDGLVTAASSRWGTFLQCIPADHPDEIGQVADQGPGLFNGWDHREFYLRLLTLAREVEADETDDLDTAP